jgi:hypothetical protein
MPTRRTGLWIAAFVFVLAFSAVTIDAGPANAAETGVWTPLTSAAPDLTGTMQLLTDGTVLVQGYIFGNDFMRLTPDATGNYINGTWSRVASMSIPRLYYASHVLQDGKLWLLGGEYTGFPFTPVWANTGEIYDPVADSWSPIAHHPEGNFGDDPSMLLSNGKILAGSINTNKSYLYDIATNTWTPAATKVYEDASDEEGWVKLPDGSVLTYDLFKSVNTVGGYAEKYVPSTNTWVSISPSDGTAAGVIPQLSSAQLGFELGPMMRLYDGRIFVIGATGHTALYTPATNTWAAGPDIIGKIFGFPVLFGADDAPAAMLPNGHVIFTADAAPTQSLASPPTEFFDFDPMANTISLIAPPAFVVRFLPAFLTRMLVLPTGQVLFSDVLSQMWVYTSPGAPPDALRPQIDDIRYDGAGVFTLSGRQLNGQSAGSNYGDDVESDENYPIVSLMDVAGKVYYARTTNWSTTEVATGELPETVNFTLPASLVNPGVYRATASGAGISTKAPFTLQITAAEIAGQ